MGVPAQAKASLPHDATVATTPTDVIAVDNNSECRTASGDNGYRVAVSHDRGATASPGACVSGPAHVMLDPVDGGVYALDRVSSREANGDGRLFLRRLDANGAIAGSREVPFADPFYAGAAAVNGGSVYVVKVGDSGQPKSMQRFDPGGTTSKCGLPPGVFYQLLACRAGSSWHSARTRSSSSTA